MSDFGVDLPSEQALTLEPFLPSHAKEWLDYPLQHWKDNLSKGQVKTSLVDDDNFLVALASIGNSLNTIISEDRISVLSRRATEDFGLPPLPELKGDNGFPSLVDTDTWRQQAVASLLVTDASIKNPGNVPGDKEKIIAAGAPREQAMKLLTRWQKRIDLVESFEQLAVKADTLTSLRFWAKGLDQLPLDCNSPCVEFTLFQNEVESLAKWASFDELATNLENRISGYQSHAQGYWGSRAANLVPWEKLLKLAKMASLLKEYALIENSWKTTTDSVDWFTTKGWEVDQVGEELFRENVDLDEELITIRGKLRKAYSRHLDRTNQKFSDLIANSGIDSIQLPFAGDVITPVVEKATSKDPVAILVLDACRYDLGCRLAALLNQGEPTQRAIIKQSMAPVPSITALGMPFALPGLPAHLKVELNGSPASWRITAQGFLGDLSVAAKRQDWLQKNYKLKDSAFFSVEHVIDHDSIEQISSKSLGKLVFVIGDDLDDHDGKLKPFGMDQVLERYSRAIRRLRSAGFSTVAVVTDHGFFHWEPDADEVQPKPAGDIIWTSRRAIAGHNLTHPAAIACKATKSDIECSIPRSISAFKTYGGLGFFHGGATLQEMVTPVVIVQWPKKAQKIGAVIKPITQIISLTQKFDIGPSAAQTELFGAVDENLLSRRVVIKILD
ncbi:MAG: PglZ domain-containing protein, partial [Deltaproteobacteria bacterium]